MKLICIIFFVTFILCNASATEPIDTDGPDFVESSEVVPKDRFQYELDMGSSNGSISGAQIKQLNTPVLLKYGIAEKWELRLASDGYIKNSDRQGIANTEFGFKYHSQNRDPATGAPSIGWIAQFQTPIASPNLKSSQVLPSFRSVITWEFTHEFALGLMPGLGQQVNDTGQAFTAGIFGAVLNKKLGDRARFFTELSVPSISRPNQNGVIISADIGGAYLFNKETQLGFRAGVGLNPNSPKNYGLLEVAQRF